jgi:GGDEF domain-containing protein
MKYVRFEQAALVVASIAVLAMLATTTHDAGQALVGLVAGGLLLLVLAAAVHFGRRGGLAAAIAASAVYTLMSVPMISAAGGLTSGALLLLVMRVAAFGLIGIVGGEVCGRLRHYLARSANAGTFDEWSHVFNERYASAELHKGLSAYERYSQQFSLVLLSVASEVTANMGPQRVRTLVRGISNYLRGDLRMVDELARLNDGRFFVLLPHTQSEGGNVVSKRLAGGVRELLGTREDAVTARCLSTPSDAQELWTLLNSISDQTVGDYAGSGEYSSAGASVLNPAPDNASSAPGASTLNMSTAAAPDGSTKQ